MINVRYSFEEIAAIVSPVKIVGTTNCVVTGIKSLSEAASSDLSFLGNGKYREQLEATRASIVLIGEDIDLQPRKNQAFMVCKNPSIALGLLCGNIEQKCLPKKYAHVHGSAIVAASAKLGRDVYVGPHTVVEDDTEIGDGVTLDASCYVGYGVTIGNGSKLHVGAKVMPFCVVGKNVILHSGVIIGSDGFGYETANGVHEKMPQIGNVIVEDDVEIGANTTIDRARFSSTRIGTGTKIDNLVQIGHNVVIGKHCLIVAQVGIAGSTTIGNHVVIGGQSGTVGHIHIGDNAMIAGQTGITSSCKPGSFLRGSPAMPYGEANKFFVCRRRLPELISRVKAIEDKLEM
ncbi:MAG: UDP-3-O-(3-hydroxymyristoyl)glucosamine N-acyltransferase [Puniceicoccales bacterium]|jgi:UDP-3-O-[3-hydroxymyristoyl] glucosamine N-acyltransferase|nr:UDP-3-O-(3-hydroxymyristoyl)glucosamine N-acyltransferase [Puniceicoccales bacterium]